MFQIFFNKLKIKKFARKLPKELKEKYGYQKYYTKAQVDAAIKRKILGSRLTSNSYAYAMYCSPEEFKDNQGKTSEHFDYGAMRSDVSETLFKGASFTFATLLVESTYSTFSPMGGFGGGDSAGGSEGGFGGDGGGGDGGGAGD